MTGVRGAPLLISAAQCISRSRDVRANVERHAHFASLAAEQGSRLVLFPELSLTGYDRGLKQSDALSPAEPSLAVLRRLAIERRIAIVAGAPTASERGLHIGAIACLPDGRVQVYEKQHLHAGEEVAFAPGSGGAPLRLGDWLVGLAICADVTHPEHAASAAARGCHVYAAGCALTPSGYEEDAALLRRYAAEHRMAVLMANYAPGDAPFPSAGRSAIWSSDGTPLNEAPAEGEWLATGSWDGAAWSDASCTKA